MSFETIKPLLEYGVIVGLFIFTYFHNLKTSKEREEREREEAAAREERILKDGREREEKLHATLNLFSQKYDVIHKDIVEIKESLKKGVE